LFQLIKLVPLPNAARILKERDFIQILVQTLKSIAQQNEASTLLHQDATGARPPPPTAEKSRKRKRDGKTPQASKESTNLVSNRQESLKTLISVFRVAEWLIETSNGGPEEDAVAREHLKSMLRTDAVTAARLFGFHLESMVLLLDADTSFLDMASNWITPYAEMWGYRARGIEDGTKTVSAVSLP
jgi:hypothetical protein